MEQRCTYLIGRGGKNYVRWMLGHIQGTLFRVYYPLHKLGTDKGVKTISRKKANQIKNISAENRIVKYFYF